MSIQHLAFYQYHKQHDRAPAELTVSVLHFTVFSPVHQSSLKSLDMEQQNTKGSTLYHISHHLDPSSSAVAQAAALQCQEMQYMTSINHS